MKERSVNLAEAIKFEAMLVQRLDEIEQSLKVMTESGYDKMPYDSRQYLWYAEALKLRIEFRKLREQYFLVLF